MSPKIIIEFKGAEFEVEYRYTEGERETNTPAEISVVTVEHRKGLMNQFFEDLDLWEPFETAIWEKLNNKER